MPSDSQSSYFGPDEIEDVATLGKEENDISQPDHASTDPILLLRSDFLKDALSDRSQDKDIEIAAQYSSNNTIFAKWDQVVALLVVSYPLYLHAESDGELFLKKIRSVPPFSERARAPKRGSKSCLAVQLVFNPEDSAQQKLCSEYANILYTAKLQQITPREFRRWAERITLKYCKAFARDERRSGRTYKKAVPGLITGYRDLSPENPKALAKLSSTSFEKNGGKHEAESEKHTVIIEQCGIFDKKIHVEISNRQYGKLFRAKYGALFEAHLEKVEGGEVTMRIVKLSGRGMSRNND